jgi:hypothetical protein
MHIPDNFLSTPVSASLDADEQLFMPTMLEGLIFSWEQSGSEFDWNLFLTLAKGCPALLLGCRNSLASLRTETAFLADPGDFPACARFSGIPLRWPTDPTAHHCTHLLNLLIELLSLRL